MVFCSQCGEKLPEDALFCLKCGVMTSRGVETGISYPWNWEKEMEKTISMATREVEKAFKTVKENIRKTIKKDAVICPHCKEETLQNSKYCYRCGKEIT